MNKYNKNFFNTIDENSYRSASIILSEIKDNYNINSVIDVGCGSGSWLRAARKIFGDNLTLTGIDGYNDKNIFKCTDAKFISHNLENSFENHINLKSDLVICMEVAEHLSLSRAEDFVRDLCSISNVILFGAAVKFQRGTSHINEQPQSFWIDIFMQYEYYPFYLPRKKLWENEDILKTPYYISNSFIFIKENHFLSDKLKNFKVKESDVVDIVHPKYLDWLQDHNTPFRTHLFYFLPSLYKALKRRLLLLLN